MHDFLDILAENAKKTVESGYYKVEAVRRKVCGRYSLKESILKCKQNPIITEFKTSSPSQEIIAGKDVDVLGTVSAMKRGGAVGISVLTEPEYFKGSLLNFKLIRENASIPLLMKDFVVSQVQVDTAYKIGADIILLIQGLFDRNYCDSNIDETIKHVHSLGMEVLLEAHTEDEFRRALLSDADLIGINNRDLKTLNVDINVTRNILRKNNQHNHIIVSESGIVEPSHIRFLSDTGAKAFLVGTAVMSVSNVEEKVRELVEA